MAEVLAKLKLKCDDLTAGFPRADMGAAVVELKEMIRRAKILPERLAGAHSGSESTTSYEDRTYGHSLESYP